jgi:Uma2 family endonuclease
MIVCDASLRPTHVPPADVLLLIEVADTSLKFDESIKAAIYANAGVREYWVIDAKTLSTRVHLNPSANGYAVKKVVTRRQRLVPTLVPALALSLGALGID